MKISIEWLSDEYDCEDCGTSWEEGAIVTFEDGRVLDLSPSAHCYDGVGYTESEVYHRILESLGHDVVVSTRH